MHEATYAIHYFFHQQIFILFEKLTITIYSISTFHFAHTALLLINKDVTFVNVIEDTPA